MVRRAQRQLVDRNGSFGSDATLLQATIQHGAVPVETERTIGVPLLGDEVPELDETFVVRLSSGTVAIGDHEGVGTLANDDPLLSVDEVSIVEGSVGTTNLACSL